MGSGSKTRPSKVRKGRSEKQKAANLRNLAAAKENIPPPMPILPKAPPKPRDYKHEFRMSQRKLSQARKAHERFKGVLAVEKSKNAAIQKSSNLANDRAAKLQLAIDNALVKTRTKDTHSKEVLGVLREKHKALKQRVKRTANLLSASISRAKSHSTLGRVTHKGVYWSAFNFLRAELSRKAKFRRPVLIPPWQRIS
ncbi:hypothetical protein B0H13DRAFT_1852083 [Mycena leptocephala]|nr:hypothetical protein B0H13DRAFT_1852083 [Mycena leptocephala]